MLQPNMLQYTLPALPLYFSTTTSTTPLTLATLTFDHTNTLTLSIVPLSLPFFPLGRNHLGRILHFRRPSFPTAVPTGTLPSSSTRTLTSTTTTAATSIPVAPRLHRHLSFINPVFLGGRHGGEGTRRIEDSVSVVLDVAAAIAEVSVNVVVVVVAEKYFRHAFKLPIISTSLEEVDSIKDERHG